MNRLWIRLSLTFGVVILLAFVAVSAISITLIRINAEQAAASDQQILVDVLSAQLARYYEQHGSLEDIESLFQTESTLLPSLHDPFFTIKSPDGEVIYGGPAEEPPPNPAPGDVPGDAGTSDGSSNQTRDNKGADTVYPITVNGATVAYLTLPPRRILFPLWGVLREVSIEELLVIGVVTIALISLLFGIIISRWLTKPLAHLADAAQDIGQGKMDRRVRETGTAETVSLGHTFNGMVERLQDIEQMRRNLVADVAHELRTPITALQAGLYAILDDAYPMTKTEIAGLYEQTRMLGRLVNDLHDLSQADANQLPLNRRPLDLSNAVEDFVAPFRIVAEGKDIIFDLHMQPNLPIVSVDESRINQVLHNLLSNALRHTPEGGTISVSVVRAGECVQIDVSDNGDGIAPEHLPHVFERFYRGDYGRSRDAGGTGLGLAIARAIVEAHQGKLEVTSAGIPGQGAKFTAILPVAVQSSPN